MHTDPIADLLTRIRNASSVGHPSLTISSSKVKKEVLKVLVAEGYIADFEELKDSENSVKPKLKIYFKYTVSGQSVIRQVSRISKPGRRVYLKKNKVPRLQGGLGMFIISTPNGMLSSAEAQKQGVGGEVVCSIF